MLAAMVCGRLMGKVSARLLVGIGFLTGAYALYEMTSWTPDVSEWTVIGAGFIQGLSIGFLAIPFNVTPSRPCRRSCAPRPPGSTA